MANVIALLFLGSGGVGKSSIASRYLGRDFNAKYDPTIEESFVKEVEVDGKTYRLTILDTSGQDEYVALRDTMMDAADAVVIVFDITRRTTFAEINSIERKLRQLVLDSKPHVPVAIVGNKLDLAEGDPDVPRIMDDETRARAAQLNAAWYVTSAKTNYNKNAMIATILSNAASQKPQSQTGRRCCTLI